MCERCEKIYRRPYQSILKADTNDEIKNIEIRLVAIPQENKYKIRYNDNNDNSFDITISHCPFCGEKLEMPTCETCQYLYKHDDMHNERMYYCEKDRRYLPYVANISERLACYGYKKS